MPHAARLLSLPARSPHSLSPPGHVANGTSSDHRILTPAEIRCGSRIFLADLDRARARDLQERIQRIQQRRDAGAHRLHSELERWGISIPEPHSRTSTARGSLRYRLDHNKQAAYSAYLLRSGTRLPDFIRLLRVEDASDLSPNKAFQVPDHKPSWGSYRFADQWRNVVRQGVVPRWKDGFPSQDTPPPNHGSARRALNVLIKNIRKGQDEDRYLVLDIDLLGHLDGIFCSPFGAALKGDKPLSEDARVIHDLSFPVHGSVNEFTVPETEINVHYDGARAIAARIEEVETYYPGLARLMSGDVSGAFRHIPLHADHCGRFAGTIPELGVLIVDLCCPFGWRNSPAAYAIAGGAINHLYSTSKALWPLHPARGTGEFDDKVWCDDHNCVEPAVGPRLEEPATELRAAMVAVLGPSACNEDKFTAWVTRGSALGLDWDLQRRTVSMLQAKIEKARRRVCD
ncbi:hypothetical protein PF008_g20466 [Phytophthora fragariae]|uniref:Uncharacterized protein n=1 Tax=Phytophthora fragariae TaxID=53985 RepID=A0A6G0QZG0_9STRA|nr:hypothetical protein PF008_g20466 [Phytophthora fragariae]